MAAAPLIKLPDAIAVRDRRRDDHARPDRRPTCCAASRPLKAGDTVLLHAAAGGVGLIVTQWAKLLGLTVIGTVSTDEKAEIARAHGCDAHRSSTPARTSPTRVREITDGVGVPVVFDSVGKTTFAVLAGLAEPARPAGLLRHRVRPDPADRRDAAGGQGLAVRDPPGAGRLHRRPGRAGRAGRRAVRPRRRRPHHASRSTSATRWRTPSPAHRDLESGRSIGSSVFVLESDTDPTRTLPTRRTS